ncbi:unnamed protein product [Closterium sp. NIES-64]|nr:unnamed protein product [Closterium sp. NIES-64]
MSLLALGDSSTRDDLQRRMRVSCGCGQIRDCCFSRAAAVTSSLDSLRAAAPCARLLFMALVAIGSSGWRTTAAAYAPLHYIACGGFCWCAPSPCHFGQPCGSICTAILGSWQLASVSGCSRHRHLALWRARLQLLVAHRFSPPIPGGVL